jgi:hypothetical protein
MLLALHPPQLGMHDTQQVLPQLLNRVPRLLEQQVAPFGVTTVLRFPSKISDRARRNREPGQRTPIAARCVSEYLLGQDTAPNHRTRY